MEFNLELAINAGLAKPETREIPIVLAPRKGKSRLRTVRDCWRSLRMMLLYSPNKLFFVPGTTLLALGLVITCPSSSAWCVSAGGPPPG
jgi:hypothetical protein